MSTHPLHRWPAPKTFMNAGDEVRGTVLAWDGSEAKFPSLHIKTADGFVRIVRVTQTRLHERLAEELPNAGDQILIRYDGEIGNGPRKTKEFTIKVKRAGDSRPPERPPTEASGEAPRDNVPGAGK